MQDMKMEFNKKYTNPEKKSNWNYANEKLYNPNKGFHWKFTKTMKQVDY
jgi:hypothetical protein